MSEIEQVTEEEIERIQEETGIAKQTLRMIDKGTKEAKKGNVSDPIDMEEDFPGLFDDES